MDIDNANGNVEDVPIAHVEPVNTKEAKNNGKCQGGGPVLGISQTVILKDYLPSVPKR